MRDWVAPMIGSALGLSLAAMAAVAVLPERPLIDIAPLVQRLTGRSTPAPPPNAPRAAAPRPVDTAPAAVATAAPGQGALRPLPTPLPAPLPAPLPRAAEPDAPFGIAGLLRPPPGAWQTGTGFFVTGHGTLLTAAHVVQGCTGVRVMSGHMRPETARVVAIDAAQDMAVLEVAGLVSPAWLPVSAPSRSAGRLVVLGFPAGALPDTPNETMAQLANAAFAPGTPVETDPSRLLWFRSPAVTHGYSGGPVVDMTSGRVVGMVYGGLDPQRMPDLYGVATNGLRLGPGAAPMLAMLSRHAVREGVVPAGMGVEAMLDLTRRATVRVVCTH